MKHILMLAFFIIMSSILYSQTTSLYAHKVTLLNNNTNIERTEKTSLIIKVTNTKLTLSTGAKWTFYGEIEREGLIMYYPSIDEQGIKCRVWFTTNDETDWVVGVKYSDHSILYYCTYIEK